MPLSQRYVHARSFSNLVVVVAILAAVASAAEPEKVATPSDAARSAAGGTEVAGSGAGRNALERELLPLLSFTSASPDEMLRIAVAARQRLGKAAAPAQLAIVAAVECRARFRLAELELARQRCEESVRLATASTDDVALMTAHRIRGTTVTEGGQPANALPDFLAALAAAERLGDAAAVAGAYANLGVAAQFAGVPWDAIDFCERALSFAIRSGRADLRALLGNNLGHLMLELGQPEAAMPHFQEALPFAQALASSSVLFNIRNGLGNAELARGHAERAVIILRESLATPGPGADAYQIAEARHFLARAELGAGELAAAESSARTAVVGLKGSSPVRAYPARATLVDVLMARGKLDEALAVSDALLADLPAQARARAQALESRALLLVQRRAYREAFDVQRQATQVREQQLSQRTRERIDYMRIRSEANLSVLELSRLRTTQAQQARAAANDRLTRNFALALFAVLMVVVLLAAHVVRARRRLERQIERSQHLDVLGRLTGGVAHDFNNLMTVVCQSMHLLKLQPAVREAPQALALIGEAAEAAQVGGRITQQLLTFARQQPMRVEVLELGAFCSDHRGLFERSLGESIALQMTLPDAPLSIQADRSQLIVALLNLLVNSREATGSRGEVRLRVEQLDVIGRHSEWRKLAAGRHALLQIIDQGCGMSAEIRRNALKPFFTTRSEGGGTGLGLSMVEGFVAQSCGQIYLRSEPGAGTTVSMVFPAMGWAVPRGAAGLGEG